MLKSTGSYAWDPLGSKTGYISGDKVTVEYTTGIHDKACRRAVGAVDGYGWVDRHGQIRRSRQL